MKIKLSFAILVLISVVSFAGATALPTPMHGYIDFPASRPYLCSLGKNGNCGAVMVEPQSVEGRKGFPRLGPADGKIASAAHRWFVELDEQSATRWTKVDVSRSKNTFHWTLTAPHRTTGWEHFITKQDWDPHAPLARSSFDLQPFLAEQMVVKCLHLK